METIYDKWQLFAVRHPVWTWLLLAMTFSVLVVLCFASAVMVMACFCAAVKLAFTHGFKHALFALVLTWLFVVLTCILVYLAMAVYPF